MKTIFAFACIAAVAVVGACLIAAAARLVFEAALVGWGWLG